MDGVNVLALWYSGHMSAKAKSWTYLGRTLFCSLGYVLGIHCGDRGSASQPESAR